MNRHLLFVEWDASRARTWKLEKRDGRWEIATAAVHPVDADAALDVSRNSRRHVYLSSASFPAPRPWCNPCNYRPR